MLRKIGVFAVAALLASGSAQADTFQVANFGPDSTGMAKFDKILAEEIARATDGAIEFQFFWAGSLGAGNEIVPLVAGGAVPFGVTAPAYYPSEMPIAGLINSLPGTFRSVADAMKAQQELSANNADYLAEYEQVGVYPIYHHGLPTLRLMCTKPVKTMDDMKGLKVRTFGYFLPVGFSSLGFVPVTVPIQDQYESLSRGVIDCVATNYATAVGYKLQEVAPYWSDVNLGAFSGPTLYMKYDTYFNEWDDATRRVVDQATMKVFEQELAELDALDEIALKQAVEEGVEAISFEDQEKVDETMPDMLVVWKDRQMEDGMDEVLATRVTDAVRGYLP